MSSLVFVRDAQGRPLMPMSAAYARTLIHQGKARVWSHPAVSVIQLTRAVATPHDPSGASSGGLFCWAMDLRRCGLSLRPRGYGCVSDLYSRVGAAFYGGVLSCVHRSAGLWH